MMEILTTQPLLDFEGNPIMSFDLAVATDGRIIEVPVMDKETGEQREFTFREAAYRVLCRVDSATLSESQTYEHGSLTAKIMSAARVKLDAKEITMIREASGAQRPGSSTVVVHWALVRILEGEVGQEPSNPVASDDA